ncbi:MAG: 2-C-methyl-D-erythritol 2,4-cyclodiphosphate synthase [Spirochaetia bacterium]|nr:2-C-methyl-D-erythritol 2,4-cyclodiphosphate synthase [Spirochaetia bacterium]
MRIGTGWDIHRLVEGRKLFIGALEIESLKGSLAHSDGDVLIHALIDALLGALALGDIGKHFPPSNNKYKDIPSSILLKETLHLIKDYSIVNIDSTIILQDIMLGPYINKMRNALASLLEIEISRISIKAKTAEHLLGEVGTTDAIIAQVVVLLEEKQSSEETDNLYWV